MKHAIALTLLALFATTASAKLPAPSEEAKAKADETKAKAAEAAKLAAYKLCQVQDKVAAAYLAEAKKAGKDSKPVATPPCVDPAKS